MKKSKYVIGNIEGLTVGACFINWEELMQSKVHIKHVKERKISSKGDVLHSIAVIPGTVTFDDRVDEIDM